MNEQLKKKVKSITTQTALGEANSGGGSHQSQHQAGQKTMKRDAFDSLDNAGKQAALKDGVSIVD